jgi:hypothetical protein
MASSFSLALAHEALGARKVIRVTSGTQFTRIGMRMVPKPIFV